MDYDVIECGNSAMFRTWLETHGGATPGIWLRIYKKASGAATITHAEALDEALCFGWIDGQRKGYDERSFLQKFTPRRARSLWSKRNIEHIERLTAAGQMREAGLREVAAAKADGRWAAVYDAPADMKVPDYFLAELGKHPQAEALFGELSKTNRYAIVWQLQTAKREDTRRRRMEKIIALLEAGEKSY